MRKGRGQSSPADAVRVSLGARAAKAAGDEFEAELQAGHEVWQGLGLCALQRGNVEARRIGGEWRVVGKSGVDFVGVFKGHAVAFDAKSHSGAPSFALHIGKGTEEAECRFLLATARAGGLGFFLIRDPALSRVYCVAGVPALERLLTGASIQLREFAKAGAPAVSCKPLVPCLSLEGALARERFQSGRPAWAWPRLFPALSDPRI